jgi:hypothetical protein
MTASLLRYAITIAIEGRRATVHRQRIDGWLETRGDDYAAHERPGVYHFVERDDGVIVGGVYGPRFFPVLDDEHEHIERPEAKMARPSTHREFDSLAAAKAWAVWEAKRTGAPFGTKEEADAVADHDRRKAAMLAEAKTHILADPARMARLGVTEAQQLDKFPDDILGAYAAGAGIDGPPLFWWWRDRPDRDDIPLA